MRKDDCAGSAGFDDARASAQFIQEAPDRDVGGGQLQGGSLMGVGDPNQGTRKEAIARLTRQAEKW